MLQSALNFAVGFFGLPLEGKYQQSITIEANGVCPHLTPLIAHVLNIFVLGQQHSRPIQDVSILSMII
jgi:hypothetical protein